MNWKTILFISLIFGGVLCQRGGGGGGGGGGSRSRRKKPFVMPLSGCTEN